MKNLIYLFFTVLSTLSWNQSFAQKSFKQIFINKQNYPIIIMRGTEALSTIEPQLIDTITVKEGDRITVRLPDNLDFRETALYGVEPMYMSITRKRPLEIKFLPKWSAYKQDHKVKEVSMASNFKGVDLAKYDQMAVESSFSPQPIFENLNTHNFSYKFQANEVLPIGFDFSGYDNVQFGSDQVSSYSSARNFEEGFSVSVAGEAPIPGTPVTVGLGAGYSEVKQQSSSEDDIYFSNFSGVEVYTVNLFEYDLADVQLSNKFKAAVKSLTGEDEVKRKIIDHFGTHYPSSVTYGGSFRSWKHISSKDFYEMERQGIDVSATVKLATPTEKKTMTNKNVNKQGSGFEEAVESTSGGAQGNAGFNFSHVEKNEYRNKLSKSKGGFRAVGGPGDNATAVKTTLVDIHTLIYPHIFKDESTEEELSKKRKWIKDAVMTYLKNSESLKKSNPVPTYKLYKVKLTRGKKVDKNLDDANQKMMGSIILKEPGTSNEYPLWKEDKFIMINEATGELKLDINQPWTIIKVPIVNGTPKDITLNAEINLVNLDDCCGNDPHVGTLPIRLKDVYGIQEFTKKVTHTAFFEETNWEVKFVIQEIPDLDGKVLLSNKKSATTNPITYATRSGSITEEEFNEATQPAIVINGPVKAVKFHNKNGVTMADAKAIAAQNGWKIATSFEVLSAFEQLNLDVYAFGMMADGRFAVPVQKDHSNFKKGPNIGAVGGNQGFFYTVPEQPAVVATVATTTTPSTSSTTNINPTPTTTSNMSKDGLFDLNATYHITDAKHNKSLVTGTVYGGGVYHQTLGNSPVDASWYFMPTGDGYYYIYDLRFNKALIAPDYYNHSSGTSSIYHRNPEGKTNAQWKITPSGVAGKYIISNRKHENAIVAGDVADNNTYLQPHNNRQNAYWTFTATNAKAPANKPNPNATATTTATTSNTTPSTTAKGVTVGSKGPDFKETPWLNNDYVRIQNKSNNTHYIHNQWGDLAGGPIQADWLSAQWKFIPYGGLNYIGNFQNRSNPELYLVNNEGKVEVLKNPSSLQTGNLLWSIFPDKDNDGWYGIVNNAAINESLQIENGELKIGVIKDDLSDALWKLELGPITGSGVVTAPPKTTVAPPKPTNVALNKPTKQSSVFGGNVSSYAVDGEIQGQSRPAHTLRDNNPWWEVDLGADYDISQINVFNITDDRFKYRTHGLYILVSKKPFTNNSGGQTFAENVFPDTEGNYKGNATGRYVRLYLIKNEQLNISEVQVIGIPAITETATTAPVTTTPPASTNTMNPASPGFVRIQNSWKKTHYLHNQNGKIEEGPIQANDVSNWWSAQWRIVPVHSGWVRIQNKWKPDEYLHNQHGKLESGKIDNNWASAMWKLVPVHSGWVRIQNSWQQDKYIHNQNGKIEVGTIDPNWASALWKVE